MAVHEPKLVTRLRCIVVVYAVLALVIAVMGYLPNRRVYGSIGDDVIERADWLAPLLLLLFLPGLRVAHRPTRSRAWWWFGWNLVACAGVVVFFLDAMVGAVFGSLLRVATGVKVETLWPSEVITYATYLLVATVAAIPVVLLATARPPPFPEARVVTP